MKSLSGKGCGSQRQLYVSACFCISQHPSLHRHAAPALLRDWPRIRVVIWTLHSAAWPMSFAVCVRFVVGLACCVLTGWPNIYSFLVHVATKRAPGSHRFYFDPATTIVQLSQILRQKMNLKKEQSLILYLDGNVLSCSSNCIGLHAAALQASLSHSSD